MQQLSARKFYLINFGIPLLVAVATFLMFDLTNIDVMISNYFYDPATHSFVLQHDRLFEKLTHKVPRVVPDYIGEGAVIALLLSFLAPRLPKDGGGMLERLGVSRLVRFLAGHRKDLLFVIVAFAVTTGAIHFLKSHTGVFCPVETTLYGGPHDRIEWFGNFSLLHKAGDGRCWPGGHASSGFTVVALYFVARRYRWRHARKLLVGALLLGLAYGTARVPQGWHYMSHTFWSGVVVWLSTLLTALAFYGRGPLSQPAIAPEAPRRDVPGTIEMAE